MKQNQIKDQVKDYYGKTLQTTDDLQTNACCTASAYPDHIKNALKNISDEVLSKYYGCGLTIPTKVNGLRVLDLGSGAGRDCFLLSQLVGEKGSVIGVDMTPEQLKVAKNNIPVHMETFGYSKPNVEFVEADIQQLRKAGLKEDDFDLIISNCVVNLVPDKEAVLSEAFSLLKEGGEFYFSDVYCNRRIPQSLANDEELWGECLSGALYWNDFENLAKKVGFADPRIVETKRITVSNSELEEKLEGYEFYSVTYRLFKLEGLEPHCEEYGQAVKYIGGVKEESQKFVMDGHHVFPKGKVESVCGNSYRMLNSTRYKENFEFFGDFTNHMGIYAGCGTTSPLVSEDNSDNLSGSSCC